LIELLSDTIDDVFAIFHLVFLVLILQG
jgi:hypothetical protein